MEIGNGVVFEKKIVQNYWLFLVIFELKIDNKWKGFNFGHECSGEKVFT